MITQRLSHYKLTILPLRFIFHDDPVAVFVCFLIFWTPHHVHRIMYIIITKSKSSWTEGLANIQETIHLIAGMIFIVSFSNIFQSIFRK